MSFKESFAIFSLFLAMLFLTIWLQFGLIDNRGDEEAELDPNDPDYYMENFVATGMDETGKRYKVIADRMVHYPEGDRALLDNPHIVQYDLQGSPSHVYAESGWLYDNRSTVLLTGNVRVVQSHPSTSGAAAGWIFAPSTR